MDVSMPPLVIYVTHFIELERQSSCHTADYLQTREGLSRVVFYSHIIF